MSDIDSYISPVRKSILNGYYNTAYGHFFPNNLDPVSVDYTPNWPDALQNWLQTYYSSTLYKADMDYLMGKARLLVSNYYDSRGGVGGGLRRVKTRRNKTRRNKTRRNKTRRNKKINRSRKH
jgi:hypothetical protein